MNKGPIRDQTFFFVGYEGIGVASRKRVWLYSPVGTIQKWPHSSSIMAYVQGRDAGATKNFARMPRVSAYKMGVLREAELKFRLRRLA